VPAIQKIIIGTRESPLALWQTNWVGARLQEIQPGIVVEKKIIKTTGDKILDSPLSKIGDKGLFTKEIERALLDRAIHIAVHSLKDIPTALPDGLKLGAISMREDVSVVFISHPKKKYHSLQDVPNKGKIATGSLRRKCQLLNHRPDLDIVDIRGNLQTRKTKLDQSDWDGMLLAKAGVVRLGWEALITETLSPHFILPAVGQGAMAIEIREDDQDVNALVWKLNHLITQQSTFGERALLRRLEGGCQIPIGAYGRIDGTQFLMDAVVGSLDGKTMIRGTVRGNLKESEALGIRLAEELLQKGADKILEEIRRYDRSNEIAV